MGKAAKQMKNKDLESIKKGVQLLFNDMKLMVSDLRNMHQFMGYLHDITKEMPGYEEAQKKVQKRREEEEQARLQVEMEEAQKRHEEEQKIGKNKNTKDLEVVDPKEVKK
jgi:hypothetical protein